MADPSIIDRRREANIGTDTDTSMVFPSNLGRHGTVMVFRNYSYRQAAAGTRSAGGLNGNFSRTSVDGVNQEAIILPLPKQMTDNASINVNGRDIEPQGAAAADVARAGGNLDFEGLGSQTIEDLFGGIGETTALGGLASVGRFAARAGLGAISPNISSGLDAGLGTTVNPHQTLTFDGVPLKQHTFSWDLSPRTEQDSGMLQNIITQLKRHMYPKYKNVFGNANGGGGTSLSRALLSYPDIVNISFVGIRQDRFYYLKPSMIRDINVDYTPQGNALLKGGNPSMVTLTMTVLEQEIHTSDDYLVGSVALTRGNQSISGGAG